MQGHSYQVVLAGRPGAGWRNLPAGLTTAGRAQVYPEQFNSTTDEHG